MPIKSDTIHCFLSATNTLLASHPTIRDELTELEARIISPCTANAEEVWRIVWDKPLYANTKTANGEGKIKILQQHATAALNDWGKNANGFLIRHIGKGIANCAFECSPEATKIRAECRISCSRLYSIQNAATAIRVRRKAVQEGRSLAILPELVAKLPLETLVKTFRGEFGFGWGPVTVLHFLTDAGVAVKPDLHLCYAVDSLGLVTLNAPNRPSHGEVLEINRVATEFYRALKSTDRFEFTFRQLDKILMEIDKREILARRKKHR